MKRPDQDFLTLVVPKEAKSRMNILAALQPGGRMSINSYFMDRFWEIVETRVNQEYLQLASDIPKQVRADMPDESKSPGASSKKRKPKGK